MGDDAFADMLRERLEAEGIEAWNEGGHNPDRVGHEAVGIFVNSGSLGAAVPKILAVST